MPRKHPIFGVPVLTTEELAAREGLSVEEYLEPIFDSLEEDNRQEEERLSDRKELHKLVRREFGKGWRIWAVGEIKADFGFRSTFRKFLFEGTSPKGERGVFQAEIKEWGGSFFEPPDGEAEIECLSNPSWEEELEPDWSYR